MHTSVISGCPKDAVSAAIMMSHLEAEMERNAVRELDSGVERLGQPGLLCRASTTFCTPLPPRKSPHIMASSQPPPSAYPFTAAMTGLRT